MTLSNFWHLLADWSQKTFGKDSARGPEGPLKHLVKEAGEALQDQKNIIEYADCLFLVFDATRRAGFSYQDLCDAVETKLEINKRRTWPKPTTNDPVEHVRN